MTQCCSEGGLRAYLDGELPPEDIQRVAAHLKGCKVCDSLRRQLAARAAHVAALVDLLPELEVETLTVPMRMPRRASARPWVGWVGTAVALAAGLGIAAYFVPPRHTGQVSVVAAPPASPARVATSVAPGEHTAERPDMAARPVSKTMRRRANRAVPEAADFVALDEEPFESGVIMRVAVTPGKVQADIVFGPDGRARAFRLVKAPQQTY